MGQDRYFKHDNVGLIHQLNVVPARQRGFVGMTLLKALFDRAAYGCLLYSCWCAQDIEANRFWEAMGFVPLAYRAGSEKKSRVHIFWQKRIREGDARTPWWFPSETTGGQMGAARIVLPIPPGRHWSDEMPVMLLPGEGVTQTSGAAPALAGPGERQRKRASLPASAQRKIARRGVNRRGGLFFAAAPAAGEASPTHQEEPQEKKPKRKNDPKLVAAARELRDRYLEHVNGAGRLLPAGKYDASRTLPGSKSAAPQLIAPLDAA